MTTNTTFTQPDIATAALSRQVAPYSQMFRDKSALGAAAHSAVGFGADLRIPEGVPGVLPRGVPV